MKRYVGYVEEIDWNTNSCKIRVPNVDGLNESAYIDPALMLLRQIRTATDALEIAEIPYHLQGLRIGDIVYCMDSEEEGDTYAILGFFGGTVNEEENV